VSTKPFAPIAYAVVVEDYAKLLTINQRLFGDGTALTPDERRDLANLMHLVLQAAVGIEEDDLP
jgi:hypothetical protein